MFNTSGPAGFAAPVGGLVHQVKLRGYAADGKPLDVKFRIVRPVAPGQWKAISTPLEATLPPTDGVHVYDVPDPRAFRVQAGDYVAVFQEGFGGAGRRWQIFASNNDWTTQKVATDKNLPGIETGFNDGELSPQHPVDQEGNSTVSYAHVELLLQAVETPDLCPGTDLPQQPCQSKLYLGARVHKTGRDPLRVDAAQRGPAHRRRADARGQPARGHGREPAAAGLYGHTGPARHRDAAASASCRRRRTARRCSGSASWPCRTR